MKENNPLVSIIIPTYNRSSLLKRALLSVLNQSYENIELIIVDDASTDDTKRKVDAISDTKIRYIRHENQMGAAVARNTGIKSSSGDFIAFQDSDDEWLVQKLEKQMAIFKDEGKDVGVVFTSFLRVEDNQATYIPQKREHSSGNILEPLLNGNFIALPSFVTRRECLEKVGFFDEQLPRFQDWELFIRLAKYYNFKHLDEPLLIAFHSDSSITSNKYLFPVAFEFILKKHADVFSINTKSYARNYYRLGKSYCEVNDLNKGIAHFKYSLKMDLFQFSCIALLLSAVSGKSFYQFTLKIFNKFNQLVDQ